MFELMTNCKVHYLYDLWSALTLYGMVSYGLPTCMYGPPTCEEFMYYMTLIDPHTLCGKGILWFPHMYIWSSLLYMEQVLYGPPSCTYGPPHM